MENTLVVNLFAGPGAGKTTCAWEIASALNKLGYVVEYVPEYAKELVWDEDYGKLDGSLGNQRHLRNIQAYRIIRLLNKVDIVVTDSPVLLSYFYLKDQQHTDDFLKETLTLHSSNDTFNAFIKRGETFGTEGRIHNLSESVSIDCAIKKLLIGNEICFGEYNHKNIGQCIEHIIAAHKKLLHQIGNDRQLDDEMGM